MWTLINNLQQRYRFRLTKTDWISWTNDHQTSFALLRTQIRKDQFRYLIWNFAIALLITVFQEINFFQDRFLRIQCWFWADYWETVPKNLQVNGPNGKLSINALTIMIKLPYKLRFLLNPKNEEKLQSEWGFDAARQGSLSLYSTCGAFRLYPLPPAACGQQSCQTLLTNQTIIMKTVIFS